MFGVCLRFDVFVYFFIIEFGIRDVRIIIRYEGYDFRRIIFSIVYEFGYVFYEF